MFSRVIFIILLFGVLKCYSRDALKYFVAHRIVQNYSFVVLANVNATDTVWVEYEYHFKGIKHKEPRAVRTAETILKVGVFENPNLPFDCKFSDVNSTNVNEQYFGYSLIVVDLLREHLHFGIKYVELNYSKGEAHLTEYLLSHKIDLLICHPGLSPEKEFQITQLHPTLKSNYMLIYKSSKLYITKDIFILTFAGTLWLCFLILLAVLALCLHISTKQYSLIYSNYEPWTWVDITLWANAAACQQGLSHTPNGLASSFIFFLGYFLAYLLYTGFAAGITSLLLQQAANNDITITDLKKMNLKSVVVMDMPFIQNVGFYNNSTSVTNMDELFMYIEQENTVGIAPKIFVDQYFAHKFNYDMIGLYSTSVITEEHYSKGFIVTKTSLYKNMLNKGLLALQQSGLLINALYRSLLPTPANVVTSNYSSAGTEHVGSAILILLVGTLSATVFLVAELTIALYRSRCYNHANLDDSEFPMYL